MPKAEIPPDEATRLEALYELELLDTPAEERFDRITRLARQYFQVPIALVSLIDSDRQWLKSRQGVDLCETSRDLSFCSHTILHDDILCVADASEDVRFADNPAVTNPPHIRFYAGAPLHASNGSRVGTLCIVDTQPRNLEAQQLSTLRDLADCVEEELKRSKLLRVQFEIFRKNQILNGHLFNTPLGAIAWDPDFRVKSWNRSAEKIFGYTAEEALGRHASELIVPPGEAREKVDQFFAQLMSASGGDRSRNVNLTKSGRTIICEWYNTPVLDSAGRVLEVTSLVDDITDRIRMEAALHASELRFRDFAEIASDWLWELDAEFRFSYLSDGFTRVSGYSPEEMLGKTRWEFAGVGDSEEERALWLAHRRTLESLQEFKNFRYQRIAKDCTLHTYSVSGKPVYAQSGEFLGYRGSARDITHIVAYETRLLHAKEVAERASRAKTEFLSSMSHELRTPLNAIMVYGQLMATDGALSDEYRDYSRGICNAGQHLLALINDILDLSKIEAGRLEVSLKAVHVTDCLDECLELVMAAAHTRGITLRSTSWPDLTVMADRVRLKQTLLNLLSNAIKYNRDGGQVVVSSEPCEGGRVRLKVQDTGKGIAPEKFSELFQPFSRLGAEKSAIEGTGIGLTIAKRVVEMMRGEIGVESTPGVGSTFWVELPRG